MEEIEKPSFENFLSKPGNLSDHLLWQLGAISVRPPVHQAAELIIGNLNEEGYLMASDEELLGIAPIAAPEADVEAAANIVGEAEALGLAVAEEPAETPDFDTSGLETSDVETSVLAAEDLTTEDPGLAELTPEGAGTQSFAEPGVSPEMEAEVPLPRAASPGSNTTGTAAAGTGAATAPARIASVNFTRADLHEALEVVRQFDPQGIACRDLREWLLYQLRYHLEQLQLHRNGSALSEQVVRDAMAIVDQHLRAITLKQFKEIARAIGRPVEAVQAGLDYVRTLDPRPGLRYNKVPARLIEPDVAFVKHGDEWLVIINDEDMPQLRLDPAYKRLLTREGNDRDTRNYVKDRYKSAIQLIKNIE